MDSGIPLGAPHQAGQVSGRLRKVDPRAAPRAISTFFPAIGRWPEWVRREASRDKAIKFGRTPRRLEMSFPLLAQCLTFTHRSQIHAALLRVSVPGHCFRRIRESRDPPHSAIAPFPAA